MAGGEMSGKAKVKKLRLVLIKWNDAWSSDKMKGDLEFIRAQSKDTWNIMTVGFVIEETKETISIAREWIVATELHDDLFEMLMNIPKKYIVSITEIRQFRCKALE